jgi:hypothetical protein
VQKRKVCGFTDQRGHIPDAILLRSVSATISSFSCCQLCFHQNLCPTKMARLPKLVTVIAGAVHASAILLDDQEMIPPLPTFPAFDH